MKKRNQLPACIPIPRLLSGSRRQVEVGIDVQMLHEIWKRLQTTKPIPDRILDEGFLGKLIE